VWLTLINIISVVHIALPRRPLGIESDTYFWHVTGTPCQVATIHPLGRLQTGGQVESPLKKALPQHVNPIKHLKFWGANHIQSLMRFQARVPGS
jgi:hypothetical protein